MSNASSTAIVSSTNSVESKLRSYSSVHLAPPVRRRIFCREMQEERRLVQLADVTATVDFSPVALQRVELTFLLSPTCSMRRKEPHVAKSLAEPAQQPLPDPSPAIPRF